MVQLKLKREEKIAEKKPRRVETVTTVVKKLSSAEERKRIERLRKEIGETREKIQELKHTNPDSPRLKKLRAHIAEHEKMLKDLTTKTRRKRTQQRPQKPRVEQTRLEIFTLKNIDVESAFKIVKQFITPVGTVVPVAHTNSLIIRDTQKNLQDIGTIIKHIDVK
jgi:type II secretory pathway component GspD/PulD (secretin)